MSWIVWGLSKLYVAVFENNVVVFVVYCLGLSFRWPLVRLYLCFLHPVNTLFLCIWNLRQARLYIDLSQFFFTLCLSIQFVRHIFHKNLHKFYKFTDRLWTFRFQIFVLFHIFHLVVQFEYQRYELLFIRLLILVKFNDPFLQNYSDL